MWTEFWVLLVLLTLTTVGGLVLERWGARRQWRESRRTRDLMTATHVLARVGTGGPYADTTPVVGAPDDRPCPDCRGRRCWRWRDSGHVEGCGNLPEPGNSYVGIEQAVRSPGRHTPGEVLRRWVDQEFSPLALDVRVWLAPTAWKRRLPVPVGAR